MAERGGQPGNRNGAKKQRLFGDALRRAIKQGDGDPNKLRKIAEKLIDEAINGNMIAIKEIADRLDGKTPQAITGADDGPVQVEDVGTRELARRLAYVIAAGANEQNEQEEP